MLRRFGEREKERFMIPFSSVCPVPLSKQGGGSGLWGSRTMASSVLLQWLPLLLLSLLSITSAAMTPAEDPVQFGRTFCGDAGNYTANSTFQANLDLLLTTLYSNATATGYYNDTKGRAPDRVYGLALCRGDITATGCQECLAGAVADARKPPCGLRKDAILLYPRCLLRYSDSSFFGTPMHHLLRMNNVNDVSDLATFDELLSGLVENVTARAAASPRRFATGEVDLTVINRIYAMAQCTRDLSEGSCRDCLGGEIGFIPVCCARKQGGVLFGGSCSLRYEIYDFYNATAGRPPPSSTTGTSPAPAGAAGKQDKKNANPTIIMAITIPSVVAVAVISIILIALRRRKDRTRPKDGGGEEIISSSECLLFDLTTIKTATENFSDSNKLGQGGFGSVYKGLLLDGQQIAVKRLSRGSWQGLEELRNEVLLVAKLQHRNLVRLIGYCLEEEEKLLVYEYSRNRSLEKFLNDPVKSKELTWGRRQKIIEGIARGLLYLHQDSRLKVIHRDLKASNVLLDEELNPKISDFGLAKLFGRDQNQGDTSRIAGTLGYMAPEYVVHGQFSAKSDVYSFGVLVLEIITGRRMAPPLRGAGHGEDLLSYVWRHWDGGSAADVVDQNVGGGYSNEGMMRCIQIGLLCVQDNPEMRPDMSMVVLMLISHSVALPQPSPLAYYPGGSTITAKCAP